MDNEPRPPAQDLPDPPQNRDLRKGSAAAEYRSAPMPYLRCQQSVLPERVRFFWQRWRELLDTLAPVSVRARTTGPRALLREMREVEALAAQSGFGAGDLQALAEEAFGIKINGAELKGSLAEDPAVRELVPDLLETWTVVKTGLAGAPPEPAQSGRKAATTKQIAHVLDRSYRSRLFNALSCSLFDPEPLLPEWAEQIDTLAAGLVTDLLGEEFSAYFLRTRGEHAEQAMSADPAGARAILEGFFERLSSPPQLTTVVIKAKASKDFWKAWPGLSELVVGDERGDVLPGDFEERVHGARRLDDNPGGARYVCLEVPAHDRGHAARLSYQEFERVSDAVCFAVPGVHPAQIEAVATRRAGDPGVLDVVSSRDAEFVFRPLRSSLADIRGRRPDFARNALSASQDSAVRRIAGALRAQRIAREERWLESGLTTLWTAVETLANERYGGSVIDNVVRSLVPFIAGTKLRDLTSDLHVYLHWAGVTEIAEVRREFPDLFDGERLDAVGLIPALADSARAERLAALSQDSPLMAFRIRRFHEVVTKCSTAAARAIQTAKRVDWQLRRVYRLRNGIIHGAKFTGSGEQLLEHLDGYVRLVLETMSQILAADNGLDTVEDAVAAVDAHFEAWRTWAVKRNSSPTPEDALRLYEPPYAILCRPRG